MIVSLIMKVIMTLIVFQCRDGVRRCGPKYRLVHLIRGMQPPPRSALSKASDAAALLRFIQRESGARTVHPALCAARHVLLYLFTQTYYALLHKSHKASKDSRTHMPQPGKPILHCQVPQTVMLRGRGQACSYISGTTQLSGNRAY